jgi:phospholipid transport system substrate-binding protein
MLNDTSVLSRRRFAAGLALGTVAVALPMRAAALTVEQARSMIDTMVGEINAVIASGKPESGMIQDFERIFVKYADVPAIARSALGPAAKQASKAQMSAFTKAFQGYISRKYGRRFREFIGGAVEVTDAKPLKSYYEVISVAKLKGESPFEIRWHVSDKSGALKFFNLIIEGVNMLGSERAELGAMLDKQKGDVDALTAALKNT